MAIYEMKDYMAKAREAVGEGIVLLRNEGAVLPFQKGSRAAVFGREDRAFRPGTV